LISTKIVISGLPSIYHNLRAVRNLNLTWNFYLSRIVSLIELEQGLQLWRVSPHLGYLHT